MVRLYFLLVFLTFSVSNLFGQTANEWIDYSKTYYKVQVAKTGIYKITYNDLASSGFPVSGIDPRDIQLFHRGIEQAIHIEGESDGIFNATDAIRFYGRRNDGESDTPLYRDPAKQPHKNYNIYTDTTAYFLTVGSNGKRMVQQSGDASGLTLPSYHLDEKLSLIIEQYAPGESFNNEIYDSGFDTGEGWGSNAIWSGQSRDFTLQNLVNRFETGPAPILELVLVGRNASRHDVEIQVGSPLRSWKTFSFTRYESVTVRDVISWSDITSDGKLNVQVRSVASGIAHAISVCYLKVIYPQTLNATLNTEKHLTTTPSVASKGVLEISNVPGGAKLFDVTSPDNVSLTNILSTVPFRAVYNNATSTRNLFLSALDLSVGKITPVTFRSITPGAQDYVIISHPKLRKPAATYADPVKAYAAYRASVEGGSFDTLLVNVQQLYDQFNYGEKSPLAIYNFVKHLAKGTPPKYLFLIGKGLENWIASWRDPNAATAPYQDLIPPAGYPGSDLEYSMGIGDTDYEPLIPTGRLSVMYPKQVANYLDKIKEKESGKVNDLWYKRVLHLSGGIEEGEPEYFRSILEGYASVATAPYFGAEVKAIAKMSRDLEVVNIAEEVNKGLSLVTFFGHSSPTTLDFDVGNVTDPVLNYRNKGKYPIMLMNGCEVGAFFMRDTLFSENWVYARDKGAAAFVAHNAFGLVTQLQLYSQIFYNVAFADSSFIHKGIGDIQKETIRQYLGDTEPSIISRSQAQQMMLLGDPAVKLFPVRKPDLEIRESQITAVPFNNDKITAQADSFALKLPIRNYGLATRETFRIEVVRTLSDNSSVTYDSLVQIPDHVDTVFFVIRRGMESAGGSNSFRITLDLDDVISELDETNNVSNYTLVIPSNATRNLYPAPFAVVHDKNLALSFQATNLYSGEREFVVEIDTTMQFSSPFKKSISLSGDVLATTNVTLADLDSITYYWRTRLLNPLQDESDQWEVTSFSFIDTPHKGWAQLEFDQFTNAQFTGLIRDEESKRFEFEKSITSIEVTTYGVDAGQPRESVSVKIKGAEYNLYSMVGGAWGCRDNTINLIAFDKRSTAPYIGIFLKWYEIPWDHRYNCGREPFVINSFTHDEVSKGGNLDIIHYVNNIAEGDSVLMFNIGNAGFNLWPQPAKEKLQELGVSIAQFESIIPGEPVVIFGKKGAEPGSARIFKTEENDPLSGSVSINTSVTGGFTSGSMTTSLIGPAKEWSEMHWRAEADESSDNHTVDVIGVKSDGTEELLFENASAFVDLSSVDSHLYPWLRLKYTTRDEQTLTPSQLDNWIVFFTPEPEGVLIPDRHQEQVVMDEGTLFSEHFRFVNITDEEFTSELQVRSALFNRTRSETKQVLFDVAAPAPFDTTRFAVEFDTRGLGGLNDFSVFVNPRLAPEQDYTNNIAQKSGYLLVVHDRLAPLLDVSFDGKHIVNGDHVSSSPLIKITLWDENTFAFKTDTTDFHMFLTYPCETGNCSAERISLRRSDVSVTPASENQVFTVTFKPSALPVGEYKLLVMGADASGNAADPFKLQFTVSDTRRLDFITPHPNPFTQNLYFGFSVSSAPQPTEATVRIIDISGRTVFLKQFNNSQLTVGRNLFSWDGNDANNNPLKPGIYIYIFTVIHEGKEHRYHGKISINR